MSAVDLNNNVELYRYLSEKSYDKKGGFESTVGTKKAQNSDDSYAFDFVPINKKSTNKTPQQVYLQADKRETVDVTTTISTPQVNGGYKQEQYVTGHYKKSILTDEKEGFNAYFLTDTPKLKDAKHTYFVTRGSDGIDTALFNDWIKNDANFAMFNSYIPQAKLDTKAMNKMLGKQPKNAVMDVTGHSLGTMNSIQAVANISPKYINKINRVNLFQGPDARQSIDKMSKQAQRNIRKLEDQGKIHYYVSAFDIVSMLNRNQAGVDEIGQVHYLLPKSFKLNMGSAHGLDQFQFNPDGTLKEATIKDNPYIFVAGGKVSALIRKYKGKLPFAVLMNLVSGVVPSAVYDKGLADQFLSEYQGIVDEAAAASEWSSRVSDLQGQIQNATGSKRIELRRELAAAVIEQAKRVPKEYLTIKNQTEQESEDEVDAFVKVMREGIDNLGPHLSGSELDGFKAPYKKDALWDSGQVSSNEGEMIDFRYNLNRFSDGLENAVEHIKEHDSQGGVKYFNLKLSKQESLQKKIEAGIEVGNETMNMR